ncbi:MAG: hypothetical protein V3T29_03755 [Alphaproteobacteria bacterium]
MESEDDRGAAEEVLPEDFPTLAAVARFTQAIPRVPWFEALGEALAEAARADASAYLSALGFPDAHVALVATWDEAGEAARNPEWDSTWWEAEEQLRAGLSAQAVDLVGEAEVMAALTHVGASASEVVGKAAAAAAASADIADQELVRAASGAAIQGCHQAALVLVAGAEEDHAFALKFRLFEAGRWPLGVVGTSFNLF